jgi:hypothetical protein
VLVTEINFNGAETSTGNVKHYKFPGTDLISAELIRTGNRPLHSEIHNL